MGKTKTGLAALTAKSKEHDPVLDALFSASIGPVIRNPASKYAINPAARPDRTGDDAAVSEDEDDGDGDEEGDEVDEENWAGEEEEEAITESSLMDVDGQGESPREEAGPTPRKRKRKEDADDLETRYFTKLAREEATEHAAKRKKQTGRDPAADAEPASASDLSDEDADGGVPVHESLRKDSPASQAEIEKAARTVFLSNVASAAATSKADKKTLLAHLSAVLAPPEKIESIRFRSMAFSSTALPKRAAFITGALMGTTTQSGNAYAVYPTVATARRAVAELNGSVVLDRHLRVDSVAHPDPVDHRRCVFVGNLTFVDDETVVNTNSAGKTTERKRTKVPADPEEGLWRTFSQDGRRVENVRVVRDQKTRVGKGFAYVQFHDANDVESALLLDGKKFPPMLPRILRVTRAKAPHKTALAMERSKSKSRADAAGPGDKDKKSGNYVPKITPEQRTLQGRAGKLLGRSAGSGKRQRGGERSTGANDVPLGARSAETVVIEGKRASARDGAPKGLAGGGKKQRAKGAGRKAALKTRGGKRAATWRSKAR